MSAQATATTVQWTGGLMTDDVVPASGLSERASADLLIDPDRLSRLIGREVSATRLRFKPGLSTTAVLLEAGSAQGGASAQSRAPEWIQVSHPEHLDKLGNALELAHQRGQQVQVLQADGLTIAHGPIDTDPRLQKGLDDLRAEHPSVSQALEAGTLRLLRYNPQRRLVLRRDEVVLRVSAHKQRGVRSALRALAAAGVPVVQPLDHLPGLRGGRVSAWPWFGQGDLASLTEPEDQHDAARAAGAALATLHRVGLHGANLDPQHSDGSAGPGEQANDRDLEVGQGTPEANHGALEVGHGTPEVNHGALEVDPVTALTALAGDLARLDGAAAERMRGLITLVGEALRREDWVTGLTHGDFSADQVLVGRPGQDPVRLIDFDRMTHGPLLADLGNFAAAESLTARDADPTDAGLAVETQPLTRALLDGYADAGGPAGHQVTDATLRTWTARALLARVLEPFRAADPDWLAGTQSRLDQIEEVLS